MRFIDDIRLDGMAVYDDLLLRAYASNELLSNPAQIARSLLVERHTGADAGMHEDIIADDDHVFETGEEIAVGFWNGVTQQARKIVEIRLVIGVLTDPVAQDRLRTADSVEESQRLQVAGQCGEEDLLMVPLQKAGIRPFVLQRDQPLDDGGGLRPPVHIVSKENQAAPSATPGLIRLDPAKQAVKEIVTAVNITDRINTLAVRHTGRGGFDFGAPGEKFGKHDPAVRGFTMNKNCRRAMRMRGTRCRQPDCPSTERRIPIVALLAACLLAALGEGRPAFAAADTFAAIRSTEARLANIGFRLAADNAALCDRLQPGLGLLLHTPDQYSIDLRGEAMAYFGFEAPIGVEAVLADSPAAKADIREDDSLVEVGSVTFAAADMQSEANTERLIATDRAVAALPADAPLRIYGVRNGESYVKSVTPVPACRSRFEVAFGSDFTAEADGELVQIGSRFFEEYPEELVAAVVAHELAHNVLRHRERLEDAGVSYGLLSGFGRNVRYFRQTELEADILSVTLLANAGYDPAAAARFWRAFGPEYSGGLLRSRSHPSWKDRLTTIETAVAAREAGKDDMVTALLASRDGELDGDWQSLIVRAD